MARHYARVKVSIWSDQDFRSLSTDAQHLYFLLLTSAKTNMAGVSDWRPKRLASLADKWTARRVTDAGAELERRRYVVIDTTTEEILIRSFVRHDGVLAGPKTAAGMVREMSQVYSPKIIATVKAEVRRAAEENPSIKGIECLSDYLSDTPSDGVSDGVSPEYHPSIPIPYPLTNNPLPTTRSPRGERETDGLTFEDFYRIYPRKAAPAKAEAAWRKATKKADPAVIISALREQLPSLAMQLKTDGDFRPYPATWLNGERWADEVAADVADDLPAFFRPAAGA